MINATFKIGQWRLVVTTKLNGDEVAQLIKDGKDIDITDYVMFNPDPKTGDHRFYDVRPGDYDAPTVFEEPVRAIDLPSNLVIKNAQGSPLTDAKGQLLTIGELTARGRKLIGYVLHNASGEVLKDGRAGLSNAANKGIVPVFDKDGRLMVGGYAFHVRVLHECNKNRIRGFVAYCHLLPSNTAPVPETRVVELEDLKFDFASP